MHFTARPTLAVQDGPDGQTYVMDVPVPGDPQTHIHNAMFNLVVTADGHVGSLDTAAMHDRMHEFDGFFQARLADELRALGIQVSYNKGELAAVVTCVPEFARDAFSKGHRATVRKSHLAHEQGAPLKPRLIALIERRYDAVLVQGLAFHEAQPALARSRRRGRPPRRGGHNLLLRLSIRKSDVLRFLTDPNVPLTNNLAERDARMMKLRQKISGGFRPEDGAKDFAVIRSLLSTARKQGWDMLKTLTTQPDRLIDDLRMA